MVGTHSKGRTIEIYDCQNLDIQRFLDNHISHKHYVWFYYCSCH